MKLEFLYCRSHYPEYLRSLFQKRNSTLFHLVDYFMASFTGYVASIKDALFLLDASCNGLLMHRQKRLSYKEKMELKSGDIFIFSPTDSGIHRWTDGKFWTPSRFQDGFLVYWELETSPCAAELGSSVAIKNRRRYKIKSNGLIKKSIVVITPDHGLLQLVSYFTEQDVLTGLIQSPGNFV